MKISAVVLTKNEEKNIGRCLNSLSFCDDIIIIDDYSEDRTIEQAKKYKVKIIQRKLNNDFASQRNFAMKMAGNEWILFIDADEQITSELSKEIIKVVQDSQSGKNAYYLKRRDFWWGKELKYGEISKVRRQGIVRLIKKASGEWLGNVHEIFYITNNTGILNNFINHYPHPTVTDFIKKINLYSTLRAMELMNQGKKTNLFQIILYPLLKFKLNYFLYLGFLDGPPGFIYAFMMSFHSFLVRIKLYQYIKLERRD